MSRNHAASEYTQKVACDDCGSSDACAVYSDGHTWCFSCGTRRSSKNGEARIEEPSGPGHETRRRMSNEDNPERQVLRQGKIQSIPNRGLTEETCRLYRYEIGDDCHIANYFDTSGRPHAQKLRFPEKKFSFIGEGRKDPGLFGQQLWKANEKNRLAITEGEIDALSLSQALGNKWPVVSLPNGAQGAVRDLKRNIEYLRTFPEIVLFFDMDEPGRNAAEEVAMLLFPQKVRVASIGVKDANEALVRGKVAELVNAYWNAPYWAPEGIRSGASFTRDMIKAQPIIGYTLRMPMISGMLGGLRKGELTLLTAGTGIGKSTLAREIAFELHQRHSLTIGNVYLEESNGKTAQGYVALDRNIPLGKLRADPSLLTDDQWDDSLSRVIQQRMFFYDHFGSLDSDALLGKLEYMALSCDCDFIVLDHISIVISGQDSSSEGERKDIDRLMTKLRSLIEKTGVGIIGIVHLKQPEGKAHEEGGRVTLSHLRGSGSLKQLADNVIALERDQQDETLKDLCSARLLKNREFGELGPADVLKYDRITGRLNPTDDVVNQNSPHKGFSPVEGPPI